MTNPTSSDPGRDRQAAPPIDDLIRLAACYSNRDQVKAAGFTFGADLKIGDVAAIDSRGRWRVGVIVRIGRLNAAVEYTTEGAIRDAADPRTSWTEPFRSMKTARFADIAARPGAEHAPSDTADHEPERHNGRTTTPVAEYDHNGNCVGCGTHRNAPCRPACPFQTGVFDESTILRATVRRLSDHRVTGGQARDLVLRELGCVDWTVRRGQRHGGYHLRSAMVATAVELVGETHATSLVERAREFLTDFLVVELGATPQPMRVLVVYLHGLTADLQDISLSLYAAAARLDGHDFNAEDFGEIDG